MKRNWNESFEFVASLSRIVLWPGRSKLIELCKYEIDDIELPARQAYPGAARFLFYPRARTNTARSACSL
jgi:hypothetical protein